MMKEGYYYEARVETGESAKGEGCVGGKERERISGTCTTE